MRLIDADELMEHVWRDKLDSRELIAKMVENAPTVEKIPEKIDLIEPKKIKILARILAADTRCFEKDYIRESEDKG